MRMKPNLMCVVPPKRRPPQGSAASSTRRPGYAGFALAPAVARQRSRWVFRKKMEIHMPKLGPDRHKGSPRQREVLTHIGDAERGSS